MKEIKITVGKDLQIEIKGSGFSGNSCSVLRELGDRLGTVKNEQFTQEYYNDVQEDGEYQSSWGG